jgi:hypothetical protein
MVDKWMQSVSESIKKRGTGGALTAQAAREGKTPAEFCRTKREGVTAKRCALSKTFAKANRGRRRSR